MKLFTLDAFLWTAVAVRKSKLDFDLRVDRKPRNEAEVALRARNFSFLALGMRGVSKWLHFDDTNAGEAREAPELQSDPVQYAGIPVTLCPMINV
jgi:hypothetical protein